MQTYSISKSPWLESEFLSSISWSIYITWTFCFRRIGWWATVIVSFIVVAVFFDPIFFWWMPVENVWICVRFIKLQWSAIFINSVLLPFPSLSLGSFIGFFFSLTAAFFVLLQKLHLLIHLFRLLYLFGSSWQQHPILWIGNNGHSFMFSIAFIELQ